MITRNAVCRCLFFMFSAELLESFLFCCVLLSLRGGKIRMNKLRAFVLLLRNMSALDGTCVRENAQRSIFWSVKRKMNKHCYSPLSSTSLMARVFRSIRRRAEWSHRRGRFGRRVVLWCMQLNRALNYSYCYSFRRSFRLTRIGRLRAVVGPSDSYDRRWRFFDYPDTQHGTSPHHSDYDRRLTSGAHSGRRPSAQSTYGARREKKLVERHNAKFDERAISIRFTCYSFHRRLAND